LGGSQGAHVLGEIVPPAVTALPAVLGGRVRISQQVRPEDRAAVATIYQESGMAAELDGFFDDVPMRLSRAHLVICRAGASTVAELAALGRPAILIPYPHATDDHQTANAHAFTEAGGGWLVPQASLSQDVLSRRIESLLTDRALTTAAASAAGFAGAMRRNVSHGSFWNLIAELLTPPTWRGMPHEGSSPDNRPPPFCGHRWDRHERDRRGAA
jgi:UDP-N-acetylglucosamine--N-acetylmuramyl-(pentapeptide) pyrophosphoryl-undecaprenol N-acetylglucosamine transferase